MPRVRGQRSAPDSLAERPDGARLGRVAICQILPGSSLWRGSAHSQLYVFLESGKTLGSYGTSAS